MMKLFVFFVLIISVCCDYCDVTVDVEGTSSVYSVGAQGGCAACQGAISNSTCVVVSCIQFPNCDYENCSYGGNCGGGCSFVAFYYAAGATPDYEDSLEFIDRVIKRDNIEPNNDYKKVLKEKLLA